MPLQTANGLLLIGALAGVPLAPSQARDCSAGRFQERAPYTHDESLPFDFAQPAGWVAESMVAGQQYVTVHKPNKDVPLKAVPMSIDVIVAFQPDVQPETTKSIWRQTMDVIGEVPYGRDTLVIFSPSWTTTAKFVVPHGGKHYQVVINFNNSDFCRPEAVKLRDLVIHSLSPNGDTTFQGT